jgi:carboxyl-terminal processing protease
MRRALLTLTLAAATAAAFFTGFALTGGSSQGSPSQAAAATQLAHVRAGLERRYYRPVPDRVLRLKSVESMLAALGDPYTEYLEPFAYSELRRRTAATYSGIGLTVLPQPSGFVVSAVTPGPSRRAGIRPGDRIVSIDGVPTSRVPFEDALALIRGRAGTTVRLGIVRGGREHSVGVRRELIRASAVSSRLLASGGRRVAYVAVRTLSQGTAQLLGETLGRLERVGASGLVLDLRGNPGGLLDQAVAVSSLFLGEGVVVSIEGAHEPQRVFAAEPSGRASTLPLVVLVDRETASAAEVVAGALKDNGRATVVGENTFGKALVQSIEPLPNGAALMLTTARYLTPTGTDISSGGLEPHVRAVDEPGTAEDEAVTRALELIP